MDEARSLVLGRVIGIGEAFARYRDGMLKDKHAFECATSGCDCPIRLCSVDPENVREPYFQACGCVDCGARLGVPLDDHRSPSERHAAHCEVGEDEEERLQPGVDTHVIDHNRILVEAGRRPSHGERVRLHVPGNERHVPEVPIVRAPRLVRTRSRWGLYRIVDSLHGWTPNDLHHLRFDLNGERSTASVFRRFGDLREARLEPAVEKNRARQARARIVPLAARDALDDRDYTETLQIFYGTGVVRPADGQFARILFAVPFGEGPNRRKVTLNITHDDVQKTRNRPRLDRMLNAIGYDGLRQVECVVFVLGRLSPVRSDMWMNAEPARTLEGW